jgi:hypothetical protein
MIDQNAKNRILYLPVTFGNLERWCFARVQFVAHYLDWMTFIFTHCRQRTFKNHVVSIAGEHTIL